MTVIREPKTTADGSDKSRRKPRSFNRSSARRPDQGRPAVGLPTRPRNRGLMAVAALLVVGFALIGAYLYSNAGSKVDVIAVGTKTITKGEVISREDLKPVSVAGVQGAIPVEQADEVVGMTASVDLVPGTLLSPEMVTSHPIPAKGQSLVGLSLDPKRVPTQGLKPGATVDLLAVPADDQGGRVAAGSLDSPAVLASDAEVTAVRGSGASGGEVLVTVLVDADAAGRVAAYSTAGRVALVEVSTAKTSTGN